MVEFTDEDLGIMFVQKIGLPFLIPLALERLEANPLTAGGFYAGDLLQSVLRIDNAFWSEHADFFQRVRRVVRQASDLTPALDEADRATVLEVLAEAPRSLTE